MQSFRILPAVLAVLGMIGGTFFKAADAGEYKRNLTNIHVSEKIQKRLRWGQGVDVGVFDGLVAPHNDLIVTSWTVANVGTYTVFDPHGTHVAGIIGAERDGRGVVGVAPKARIHSYGLFDDNGSVPVSLKDWLDFAYAQKRIEVANMSFVPAVADPIVMYDSELHAIAAYRNRTLIAKAAGNDGKLLEDHQCTTAKRDCREASTRLKSLMIVGALRKDGKRLTKFSNRPGSRCFRAAGAACKKSNKLRYFFIVASGEDVRSTAADGQTYFNASGTSMAAPHVAGAAALLMSRWTFLKRDPGTTAKILFETADDLGRKGVDGVYGWGRLNVTRASTSQGKAWLPTGTSVAGPAVGLDASRLDASTAFGDAVAQALSGQTMAFFDKYGRDFQFDAGAMVSPPKAADGGLDVLSAFGRKTLWTTDPVGGRGLAFHEYAADAPGDDDQSDGFAVSSRAGAYEIAFSHDLMPSTFALSAGFSSIGASDLISAAKGDSTHLDLIGPAAGFSVSAADAVSLGPFGKATVSAAALTRSNQPQNRLAAGDDAQGYFVGADFAPADGVRAGLRIGQVHEDAAAIGSSGTGYFAFDGATTSFVGVGATATLSRDLELGIRYERGWANIDSAYSNALASVGAVTTEAFGAELMARRVANEDDRLRFSVSQPMRIAGGTLSARLPVGRTVGGEILFDQVETEAEPSAREVRLQLDYARPILDRKARLAVGVVHRLNPGHRTDTDDETIGLLRFTMKLN